MTYPAGWKRPDGRLEDKETFSMKRVAVLVAVEPRMLREALCERLAQETRIAVACEGADPVQVLAAAARIEAGVVVVTSEPAGIPPLASHLFAEFPEITVVGICRESGEIRVHRQVVATATLSPESIERLVAAIISAPAGEAGRPAAISEPASSGF